MKQQKGGKLFTSVSKDMSFAASLIRAHPEAYNVAAFERGRLENALAFLQAAHASLHEAGADQAVKQALKLTGEALRACRKALKEGKKQ